MPGSVLRAMVGPASVEQAVRALERAAIPHEPVMSASGIATVKLERVWAEAYVPYANYRGAVIDQHGKAWIPLDAGFKRLRAPQVGDPQRDLGLDPQALVDQYLTTRRARHATGERARARDAAARRNRAGTLVDEFLNHRDVLAENLGLLPSTLPYRPTGSPEVGYELPEVLRHTIHFKAEAGERILLEATLPVADLLGRRLTLSYLPFAPEDEDLARQFGGLLKTPPYLVQVKPVLKSGGVDLVGGTGAVGLGVKVTFTLEFHTPGGTQTVTNDIVAGNLTAIGLGGRGVARQEELGGKGAQILSALAQAYLESWDKSDEELAAIFKVVPVRPTVSACFVLSEIDVDYAGGDPLYPRPLRLQGVAVDADLRASAPVGIVDAVRGEGVHDRVRARRVRPRAPCVRGHARHLRGIDGQGARARGGRRHHGARPHRGQRRVGAAGAAPRGIRQGRGPRRHRPRLLARVPAAPVSYMAWTGVGYVLIDEETGEAAYQLQGGHSGGVTAPSVDGFPPALRAILREPKTETADCAKGKQPASLEAVSDTGILGTVNKKLDGAIRIRVKDVGGNDLKNACVTFTVLVGDGRLLLPSTGAEGDQVTVRADDSGIAAVEYKLGKSTRIAPRFVCEDGRSCTDASDADHYTQVGMNQVTANAGAARLGAPFTFYALPDGQCDGGGAGSCKAKLALTTPAFRSGFFNLGVAGLMQVSVLDPYDNPLSNFDVRFAPQPPKLAAPPEGYQLIRDPTSTPGKLLKPADYRKCIEADASPGQGDCAGETGVATIHSSSTGAHAYAVVGDSLYSLYEYDIGSAQQPKQVVATFATGGMLSAAPRKSPAPTGKSPSPSSRTARARGASTASAISSRPIRPAPRAT